MIDIDRSKNIYAGAIYQMHMQNLDLAEIRHQLDVLKLQLIEASKSYKKEQTLGYASRIHQVRDSLAQVENCLDEHEFDLMRGKLELISQCASNLAYSAAEIKFL